MVLVVACVGLLAGGFLWHAATRQSHAKVITGSSARKGWQTIEYQGVRVDIPDAWQRIDTDDCEFTFEHWGPSARCTTGGGVAFYPSATFDPAHGPGLRRTASTESPAWSGYAYAGDFAVYVADDARTVVQQALSSVR